MKNFRKIISVLILSLLAFLPLTSPLMPALTPAAEASHISEERINEILSILGIDIKELQGKTPEEIEEAILNKLKGGFDKIPPVLTGGASPEEIINDVLKYLSEFRIPEITSEAETTAEYITEAPPATPPYGEEPEIITEPGTAETFITASEMSETSESQSVENFTAYIDAKTEKPENTYYDKNAAVEKKNSKQKDLAAFRKTVTVIIIVLCSGAAGFFICFLYNQLRRNKEEK